MINFFSENDFKIKDNNKLIGWIESTVLLEGFEPGEINYIFCDDNYLLDINFNYLGHDTYTDIVTFNYNEEKVIHTDIYISTQRVFENAKKFNTSPVDELHRVMIHGILHLCGYNDSSPAEKAVMRQKEDYFLSLRDFL
ncbi:MAG: rRNA maturation RNase YbeY [Flavobacteriales bacterium]|nr:MAG: rRNA maturation RNase YbeY [Flavobacteriales bacterium]